jgi:ribokinase
MSAIPRIFVAGSANVDLTFRVPGMPRLGVTEVCPYALGFGGKGANQAVQAARLGAAVSFLGKVGDDPFGPAIVAALKREGIGIEHVTTASRCLTGTAIILVDPSGRNSIVTHGGPNVVMTRADACRAEPDIVAAGAVLLTLEIPEKPLTEILRIARRAGIRIILNPAPAVDFPHALLKRVDLCLPNESELAALTGMQVRSLADVEKAAEALRSMGPREIVVTRGERGALVLDDQGFEVIPACRVKAVDTSGAGDSFAAAIAVALTEGNSLREAAFWANRVAAISVTRAGTQSSFPVRREIQQPARKPPLTRHALTSIVRPPP